jgi:hypothetical protein
VTSVTRTSLRDELDDWDRELPPPPSPPRRWEDMTPEEREQDRWRQIYAMFFGAAIRLRLKRVEQELSETTDPTEKERLCESQKLLREWKQNEPPVTFAGEPVLEQRP